MTKKPKRKNLKPPGKCIFCGGDTLTKEHVWAEWLKPHIPRTIPKFNVGKNLFSPNGRVESSVKRQEGDPHAKRLRCVCKTCNIGWMAKLQEEVKPIVVAMLSGGQTRLYVKQQTILSAWIGMAVMVGEFEDLSTIAIPQSDRTFLMESRKLPSTWRVWIGRYSRQEWKPRWLHNTLFVAKEDTPGLKDDRIYPPNTQNTTWIVGNIFTHSLSSSLRGALRRWNFPMSVRSALLQIWPVKTNHDWPPVRIMTDADAETAGTALFRRALSLMEMRNRFRGDT